MIQSLEEEVVVSGLQCVRLVLVGQLERTSFAIRMPMCETGPCWSVGQIGLSETGPSRLIVGIKAVPSGLQTRRLVLAGILLRAEQFH